jgi:hypothetical protein
MEDDSYGVLDSIVAVQYWCGAKRDKSKKEVKE